MLFDRFGRKITFYGSLIFTVVWWVVVIFAPVYPVFVVGRFFVAVGRISSFVSGFLLCKMSPHSYIISNAYLIMCYHIIANFYSCRHGDSWYKISRHFRNSFPFWLSNWLHADIAYGLFNKGCFDFWSNLCWGSFNIHLFCIVSILVSYK